MIRPFGIQEFWFIILAVRWTIALSAAAFAGGAVGGLVVALARVSKYRLLCLPALGFIRLFQGTPLLMQLFLTYFGLQIIGFGVSPWVAAALALTVHAAAFLGEIWRGCIQAVPEGQSEASWALGLSYFDRMKSVILPQAARIALAPTVGFLVQLIKGTSLASIIGFVELMRAAQIMNNATYSPLKVYGLVTIIYFCLCWPLSVYARRMEGHYAALATR
ncbi:amino acid ABC transporter permease [Mesorhizobium sp. XAP10]|uniref:amino acid ABC transporter permease n=1 Tax=unclassified Mesorhizobium TaxID=325217 RepID=UPI0023E00FB1|nr:MULTISPECIES: amino acid ABC transporter permease [unclassified Mesorhizobium]MDF3156062.1 amino acid ABC transporter permease [Mesorhizobium sp. XAP10]MDF3248923.1 amino acid ABC transporter permease [Mesorhizobium sp. XAP4]